MGKIINRGFRILESEGYFDTERSRYNGKQYSKGNKTSMKARILRLNLISVCVVLVTLVGVSSILFFSNSKELSYERLCSFPE